MQIPINLSFDGRNWHAAVYEGSVQHLREHLGRGAGGRSGLLVVRGGGRIHMAANYIRFPGGRVWSLPAQGWIDG
jgi:hypothetical protein